MNLKKEVKELRRIIHEQAIEITKLRDENSSFRKRVEELEGKQKEKPKPDFIKEPIITKTKKTGQKKGHEGCSMNIPERIDEIKEHKFDKCPRCGGVVSNTQETRERYVTDIPEVKSKNTKHIIHRCYCSNCNKIVEPVIRDALPNARFGLRLMLLIMILKFGLRIPSNKIRELMKIQYEIKISDGEIYQILRQLSREFGQYYDEIKNKIIDACEKNIDETSWRINGKNYWLWIFINKEVALYIIKKQRSSNVPIEILGDQKDKIIGSDRLEAYSKLSKETGSLQQVCWSHLIRNSKDLTKHYSEAKYIHKRLKYIYKKAKEGKTSEEKLLHWINLIGSRTYNSNEVFKFIKAICRKHYYDLFRFVENPKVDSTNNVSERGLRHAVVIRKISNGSRSERGAEITGRLLSVIKSLELQGVNPYTGSIDLLQKAK